MSNQQDVNDADRRDVKGYERLREVLQMAYNQAAVGKGRVRHADEQPFDKQLICQISRHVGVGFATGQAIKKIVESKKIRHLRGADFEIHELLGAVNYLCGAIITLQDQVKEQQGDDNAETSTLSN